MMSNKETNLKGYVLMSLCIVMLAGFTGVAQHSKSSVSRASASMATPLPASITDGVWLKGDLHLHSSHSKESSNNPVSKIIAFSKSVGIGYICISDHDNHVQGDVAHHTWIDPDFKSDDVLLLYGAEWTTTRGHGNTFSSRPYNHQRFYDVRDQRDTVIGRVKKEEGFHLSANHPAGPKDHFGFSYDIVNSMEVWNSARWEKNANSILIWEDMLASGRRITGRGGSDAHHGAPESPDKATPNSKQVTYNYVGTPTTWVFATNRTSQAVVDALTNGRVSISSNPYAPRVEFYADVNQDNKMDMMMGDNAKATGQPVKFRIQLSGNIVKDSIYTVSVLKNSNKTGTYLIFGNSKMVEFTDTPETTGRVYYRVIVEGPPTPYPEVPDSPTLSGRMVGMSNPIYFNFDPHF